MQKDMSIRESEQPVSELKRLSHTSEIEKGGLMTEQENTESNVGLDRAEVTAAIQRSIEVTAGQAGMMQAIHPLTGQDQLSVHGESLILSQFFFPKHQF